ncbi:MAG: YciI family protein [Anaerolineae bacterium]|nr:YciI family protein [Anaerolineae bacterium]
MNQYLYKILPVRPEMLFEKATPEEEAIVAQHFDYLKNLVEQGVVILAGRTQTTDVSSFGIIIFQAESDEAARAIMHDDPAVKNRVMRAELYPYRIALHAPENIPT